MDISFRSCSRSILNVINNYVLVLWFMSYLIWACLLGSNVALNIWGHIATVGVVLWPMCCHTGTPCRRYRTWHPTPSQYTDTGPICRCAIHWCGTSHWNTQPPIFSHTQWVSVTLAIRLRPSSLSSAWTFLVFRLLLSNPCMDLLQILCGCSLGGPLLSLLKSGCYPYFSWNYG